ncbi:hypothetical protein DDE01_11800 [Desulfovibrio desulfuricans]|nr:hypothetical protein DDE01_11800 [Desulfovibrio desulfuricans]
MTEHDYPRFAAAMMGLAENYGKTISDEGMAMRFQALAQYPVEAVTAAAMSLMVSRKYTTMPTIADFIEHIGGGAVEDIAEREAGKVVEAVKCAGPWRSVAFDDPVTQAVIEQGYGGWVKLCEELTEDKLGWFRKDFARIYAGYRRQGVQVTGHMAGLAEIDAGSKGGDYNERLVLVGAPQKALRVAASGNAQPVVSLAPGAPSAIAALVHKALPSRHPTP